MLHRTLLLSIIVLLTFTSFAAPASAQKSIAVGTKGARVELGSLWKAGQIEKSLGGNQFAGRSKLTGAFLVVMEQNHNFLSLGTAESQLESIASGILAAGKNPIKGRKLSTSVDKGFHVTQGLTVTLMGVRIYYSVHLLGYEDLGYVFLSWSIEKNKTKLDREVKRLTSSFKWPSEKSPWARRRRPRTYSVDLVGGGAADITVPGHYFKYSGPDGPILAELSANSGDFGVYAITTQASSAEEVAQDTVEMIGDVGAGYTFQDTVPVKIGTLQAQVATLKRPGGMIKAYAIPISGDLYMDLRFEYGTDDPGNELLRKAVLNGFSIRLPVKVDAFPGPAVDVEYEPQSSAEAAFFGAADRLCTLAGMPSRSDRTGTKIVMASYSGVESWKPGQKETEQLFSGSMAQPCAVSIRSGTLHVLGSENQWQVIDKGVPKDRVATGGAYADLGGGKAAYLKPRENLAPGFGVYQTAGKTELLIKEGNRLLVSAFDFPISALYAAPSGDSLLALYTDESRGSWWGQDLMILPTASGTVQMAGHWQTVRAVGQAPTGWLVSGRPENELDGVWLVSEQGKKKLLVGSSNVVGVDLDMQKRFRFAVSRKHLGSFNISYSLWELEMPYVERLGSLGAISPVEFQKAVVKAFKKTKAKSATPKMWISEASIRKQADAIEVELQAAGFEFPSTDVALDRMFNELGTDLGMPDDGRFALGLLLSRALLNHGAKWIKPSNPKSHGVFVPLNVLPDFDHAVGYMPLVAIEGYSSDESMTWNPIETALASAAGRRIVMSTKFDCLQRELKKGYEAPLNVADATLAGVREFLKERGDTERLRSVIYRGLAGLSRWDDIVAIAGTHAKASKPAGSDLNAWLGARVQAGGSPVAELRDAIAAHPNQYEFYLMLGQSYEQATPKEKAKARACYNHVVVNGWGRLAELAEESLTRLGK